MISHVYLMLAALPVVCGQCTTSRCQDSKYEPPRWENGAVYLESLLTETSNRILSAVESRLADQTATMASRLANQTATMDSRLAQHAEAFDARLSTLKAELENSTTDRLEALESRLAEQSAALERRLADQTTTIASHLAQHTEVVNERLATLKTELENSTTNRLEALEERMVVENRNLVTNSESHLNLTIGAMMNTMESRLADQTTTIESRLVQHNEAVNKRLTELENSTTIRLEAMESRLVEHSVTTERRLVGQTATIERRLAQHGEAIDERLATLKTELDNSATNRLEAVEERMVVENRNISTNSESRLNLTIAAIMNNMEGRLTTESRIIAENCESRLNLTISAMMKDMEERMIEESRNGTTSSESRLNLTISAMMNNIEERLRHDIQNAANTTEIQLKEVQTQTNVTVRALLHGVEARLTALCSSPISDTLLSAVYNSSNAELQILKQQLILRLIESRVPVTFLRRVDGSVNFTRNWADYKSGFGEVGSEYWLGLDTLYQLTTQHQYGLRVDMEDFSGERKWATYQSFRVGSESGNYVLTVTGYNPDSTAGDSLLARHNGMAFTTVDRDNDQWAKNCADDYNGGWWYNACYYAHPTGPYKPAGYRGDDGITWYHAYRDYRSFKSMSLKLVAN